MARSAWKPADAGGTSWTIKGVQETTRDAVREAAAEAEMLIGDWVDRALAEAAHEALHPSPPPATRDDVAAILEQLTELKSAVLALAEAKAGAEELAEVRARVEKLAESKANVQDLTGVEARVQKLAERSTGYDRPPVRHVMVEKKKPTRQPVQPRTPDKDPHEP